MKFGYDSFVVNRNYFPQLIVITASPMVKTVCVVWKYFTKVRLQILRIHLPSSAFRDYNKVKSAISANVH